MALCINEDNDIFIHKKKTFSIKILSIFYFEVISAFIYMSPQLVESHVCISLHIALNFFIFSLDKRKAIIHLFYAIAVLNTCTSTILVLRDWPFQSQFVWCSMYI